MSADSLGKRTDRLAVIDIATLMPSIISDIRVTIANGDSSTADYLLSEWELALGAGDPNLLAAIRGVHRRSGYRAALATFAIDRRHRREGLESFHTGLRDRSRYMIDRWRWIASAYGGDIVRFIEHRGRLRTAFAAADASREARQRSAPPLPGAFTWIVRRRDELLEAADGDPAMLQHAAERLNELVTMINALAAAQTEALKQRATAKAAATPLPADTERRIESLTSIDAQIAAYTTVTSERAHERRKANIQERGERLDAGLECLRCLVSSP